MSHKNTITAKLPFGQRQEKPRKKGLNYVRAPRILGATIKDLLEAYSAHIDILKLSGHQAAFSSENSIKSTIKLCHGSDIQIAVGNPVIDSALTGGSAIFKEMLKIFSRWGVDYIEISGIARSLDDDDLEKAIELANKENIGVIYEIGVDFAHTVSSDNELFVKRRNEMAKTSLEAGAAFVLIESEGLTENLPREDYRWETLEELVTNLDLTKVIFEGDDQDVLSKLLEVYGPKSNMMIDYTKIEKIEAARRGFGPSQFLWGKVAILDD